MLRSHVHLWQVQLYSNYGLTHRIHKSDILHFCYMFHLRVYIFKDVYIYISFQSVFPLGHQTFLSDLHESVAQDANAGNKGDAPAIALDCEGIRLGRFGRICRMAG